MLLAETDLYNYQVKNVHFISETIYCVNLQNLSNNPMQYTPGQLCKIYCSDGKGRYFSIINFQSKEQRLKIHLRIKKNTADPLKELTKPGTHVPVEGPFGEMHKLLQVRKTKILLAEGLGLSAFHSILDHFINSQEKIYLIWIRSKIDKSYSKEDITNWKEKLNAFHMYELDREENSLLNCLDYCKTIIAKNQKAVLAFAGTSEVARYIQDKFISNQYPSTVSFLTDAC